MRIAIVCAAVLAAAPLAVSAQDAGSRLAATCAMCHGTSGHSVGGNERLAGMPKDEMVRKFREFQSGAKPATVMHQLSKGFTDQQLDQIAAYFAAQKK
jgi:cytochrome c553